MASSSVQLGSAFARDVKALEQLKDLYADLCQIPMPTKGRIVRESNGQVEVTSVWTNRALAMKKLSHSQRISVLQEKATGFDVISSNAVPIASTEAQAIAYSESNAKVAQLFTVAEKDDKKFYLSVFDQLEHIELLNVDLSGQKKHGKVYPRSAEPFGVLSFSAGEGHVLFAAEKNVKSAQFFDADIEWDNEEKVVEARVGSKYELTESWGEACADVVRPVLCIADVVSGSVTVLDQVPSGISPSYATWAPGDSGVLFFGMDDAPFRLGRIYCNNRRGALYYYDLASASLTVIGEPGKAIESPSFAPDGDALVFLQREADGPHASGLKLMRVPWPYDGSAPTEVVDVVRAVDANPDAFPGIYAPHFAQNSWCADKRRVVFDTIWGSKTEIVVVDTVDGSVARLTNNGGQTHGSWSVLDVAGDLVLAVASAPNRPYTMLLGRVPAKGSEEQMTWTRVDGISAGHDIRRSLADVSWKVVKLQRNDDTPYEAIFITPNDGEALPLVVYPHGGPHSACLLSWPRRDIGLLLNAGFAVLMVNYHGSIGFGEDFVRSLPGRVGDLEIGDTQHAAEHIIATERRINPKAVVAFGGSHGGFSVSHLIGQYPAFYKACCALNPVLNIDSMYDVTDITDWTWYEALGVEPQWSVAPTPEQRARMTRQSPIYRVGQVVTPYLLLIGEKDLRVVPHYRGFMRNLQARGVPNKVLSYPPSNHPLAEVEVEADFAINMLLWFEKHI